MSTASAVSNKSYEQPIKLKKISHRVQLEVLPPTSLTLIPSLPQQEILPLLSSMRQLGANKLGNTSPLFRSYDMRLDVAGSNELEEKLDKIRESGFIVDETYEKARLEVLRSAMESAKDAIKACILINGGAAGALLVFMGHLATAKNEQLIRDLAHSLKWFMAGLIAAIIAHGMAYASNLNFSRRQQVWKKYRMLAIALTITSISVFTLGGYWAYRAFFETAQRPPSGKGTLSIK